MELAAFETIIRERANALIKTTLSNQEFVQRWYSAKKADPTLFKTVGLEVDSAMRFDMAMTPHDLVGDEYFKTEKYDSVMNRVRLDTRETLGKAIYKELW